MSERVLDGPKLGPEGPSPKPGLHKVEAQEETIARFEAALAEPGVTSEQPQQSPQPSVVESAEPAEVSPFKVVDKRNVESQAWSAENSYSAPAQNSETAQAELDKVLAAVEDKVVADPSEAAPESEVAPVVEAAVSPKAIEVSKSPEVTPKQARKTNQHHDFHKERPAGPIVRDARNRPQYVTGGFARNEDYDKQRGVNDPRSADKHYDEVNGLSEVQSATPERPSYETMDTDQLIFAYAKAEMIGDKYVTDEIRDVYTTAMEEAYTKPGSPITYEEHQEALARFDRLTNAAIQYEKAKDPEQATRIDAVLGHTKSESPESEGLESQELTDDDKRALLNGEMVFPEGKFVDSEGNVFFDVMLPDGSVERMEKGQLTFEADEVEAAEAEAEKKKSFSERLKGTWEKSKRGIKNAFSNAWWGAGARWTTFVDKVVVSRHVTEGMTDEEANKQREKNRRNNMLGLAAAGLVLGTAAVTAGVTHMVDSLSDVDPSTLPPVSGGDIPSHVHHAVEAIAPAPNPNFNIQSGEGGYELFGNLNIDASKWNDNAQTLLDRFPQDFYRMPGGGIGIAHQGLLSPDAQTFINGLK